jgi:hypothetical protein
VGADRNELINLLAGMSQTELDQVAGFIRAAADPPSVTVNPESDFATEAFAVAFGGILRSHHVVSHEAFTKDKFEHALEKVMKDLGHRAARAPRGLAGRDLDVDGERWSLKTQADKGILRGTIHISKFMELGKGAWATQEDLYGLRAAMFKHMEQYDRIVSLRCISQFRKYAYPDQIEYELVEIPKPLLARAEEFPCNMHMTSSQTPKPGSCAVLDDKLQLMFELYFDGGTERKLQVRRISKANCVVHASWIFPNPAVS